MKKKYAVLVILGIVFLLSGCSLKNDSKKEQEEEDFYEERSEEEDQEDLEEDSFSDVEVCHMKGVYAENQKMLYFAARNTDTIYAVDKKTDTLEEFVQLSKKDLSDSLQMSGNLYGSGDYLYYVQHADATPNGDGGRDIYWKIDKTSGEKSELDVSCVDAEITKFYIVDETIYFQYWKLEDDEYVSGCKGYRLTKQGDIGEEIPEQENLSANIPSGYSEVYISYTGDSLPLPYQEKYFSKYLLSKYDETEQTSGYVLYDPQTGEEEAGFSSENSVIYYDGKHLIYLNYQYDEETAESYNEVYCYDVETGKVYETDPDVLYFLDANEEELYYYHVTWNSAPENEAYDIYRLSFDDIREGKNGTKLMTVTQNSQVKDNLYLFLESFVTTQSGQVYYVDCRNGELQFIHLDQTKEEDQEKICGILEVSRLKDVGEYKTIEDTVSCESCGEIKLGYSVESFEMYGQKPGDQKINEILKQTVEETIQEAMNLFGDEGCESHMELPEIYNTETVDVNVSYLSDDYIGFLWNSYEYYRGAAHGMPFQNFRLFDRNTGEELMIGDILATSQDDLNQIIYQKFEETYTEEDFLSMDYIRESAGYYTDQQFQAGSYYLTQEGFVYFFGAYEVASYAQGMPSVLIPFEELTWKIDL